MIIGGGSCDLIYCLSMKAIRVIPLLTLPLATIGEVGAATMSFSPSVNSQTDVDWTAGTSATKTVQKFFTGDNGENLSLRMDLSVGGSSSGLRADGSGAAYGWQPDGGTGAQSYRWSNGEIAYWTTTILDRDNGNADVTSLYNIRLTSMEATNRLEVPDSATIVLTNGFSQVNSMQAGAGTGEITHNFTNFDAKSMTLEMTNNPANAPQYFRVDTVGFEVTSIPEPSSVAPLGLGGLGLLMRRRK